MTHPDEYNCSVDGCEWTYSFEKDYRGTAIHMGYWRHLQDEHPDLIEQADEGAVADLLTR